MTSQINYASINENFPVAGQDNDTQVFRDNFDTIKTSLRTAKDEITELQANTTGLQLTEAADGSDFNNGVIYNAVLQNTIERRFDGNAITSPEYNIEFENANYQKFRFGNNVTVGFVLPTNDNPSLVPGVGKITLELYSDGSTRTLTFTAQSGTKLKTSGFTDPKAAINTQSLILSAANNENPVIVEVWQHESDNIFMKYVGQFNE